MRKADCKGTKEEGSRRLVLEADLWARHHGGLDKGKRPQGLGQGWLRLQLWEAVRFRTYFEATANRICCWNGCGVWQKERSQEWLQDLFINSVNICRLCIHYVPWVKFVGCAHTASASGTLPRKLQYELMFHYTFYCPQSVQPTVQVELCKSPNMQLCKNSVGQRPLHWIIEN